MPGALWGSCRGSVARPPNRRRVPDAPDTIVLKQHRDLDGREKDLWIRRALFALLLVVPLLALFNLFGQRPGTSKATVSEAALSVYAPTRVRGGLLWEARFHITAHREIKKAILILGSGWLEGVTGNTGQP